MNKDQTVFVVDDEPDVRAALGMLIRSVGLKPEIYENPQAFLDAYDPERPGCLVLDMRMPGMSGLDLQEKLASMGQYPPIIMISGHGEIPNAVQAVQSGAVDFLQKPVSDQLLLDRIQQALRLDTENRKEYSERHELEQRYATLTTREREVLQGVIAGKLNKTIADELSVSTRTVEIHRAHLMEKMKASSLPALLSMSNCIRELMIE
ncbi:MAG TPA: response regulator transcription factor [Gammaproteobacteria bacterium]|nr:response regulator transcription factor [Gammaproteobacteria bacterium]